MNSTDSTNHDIEPGDSPEMLTTELLILPDGRILVHNLTQPFAELLRELNPDAEQIQPRAGAHVSRTAP